MEDTRPSLLLRVRDRADDDSWSEFVALYEPLLLSYVRHRGLGEHDARDVVQNVFSTLLRTLPTFELDRGRGRFRSWLWRVAQNALVDWARRRKRRATAEDEARENLPLAVESSEGELEEQWRRAHQRRVLEFVLQRVRGQANAVTWQCFEQHIVQGRRSAEVAAALGVTSNAVCVNSSRILTRVREMCAEYDEDLGGDSSEP
jgi:RNA polymerase sigma factor (sigma-70 family)